MAAANPSSVRGSSPGDRGVHHDFFACLEREERHNWEGRRFYHTENVKRWMNSTIRSTPNISKLLADVADMDRSHFSRTTAEQLHHANSLLVFAVLLHPDVSCGHLIHIFAQNNFSDKLLHSADLSNYYRDIMNDLCEEKPRLPDEYQSNDYGAILSAFDNVRWEFSPARIELLMNNTFLQGFCILPFCFEEVINKKGGTANVHHYKIQEDLISANLKAALAHSRHKDSKFGWCYDLAVKSYIDGWSDAYEREIDAFRGTRGNKGVVKYIGEYRFRDPESKESSPNHNIILEYGERDLDEYLADTYPPVLNTEIIAFWDGLFKVANTLKQLHDLEYQSGGGVVQYFKGWHGDIKPDNILRVGDEYKLADFGFTQFKQDDSRGSRTLLSGITRTYGAPECDAEGPGANREHLQTIDTWSFGCVLSAVATWVVLGSQAYDNYRKVRIMEIAEIRKRNKDSQAENFSIADDAFHDGKEVLPSVLHWHDFLRNSSKKADTITCQVLDLVDNKMLLEDPTKRFTLAELCAELDNILVLAAGLERKTMEKMTTWKLKVLAPDTLKALLRLDKCAPVSATPKLDLNLPRVGETDENAEASSAFLSTCEVLHTGRIRKSERLERIVLGKTANREGAIKKNLGLDIEENSGHQSRNRWDVQNSDPRSSTARLTENRLFESTTNINGRGNNIPQIHYPEENLSIEELAQFDTSDRGRGLGRYAFISMHKNLIAEMSDDWEATNAESPQPQRKVTQRKGKEVLGRNTMDESRDMRHAQPTPMTPPRQTRYRAEPQIQRQTTLHSHETAHSSPILDRTLPPSPQMSPNYVGTPVIHNPLPNLFNSSPYQLLPTNRMMQSNVPLPNMQLDLERTNIFQEKIKLEKLWGDRRLTSLSSILGRSPIDHFLKQFISNRDIIFVVDNAFSMLPHWRPVSTVLKTLAMKVGSLDKDGLDLMFTIGDNHNLSEVRGREMPRKFEQAAEAARREIDGRFNTNMKTTLQRIFDAYEQDIRKKMTLIILTDGLWHGSASQNDVEILITKFITNLRRRLKKWEERWFSIQFIYFGDDRAACDRLNKLDNEMDTEEDVIDTKPWWYPEVDKLILGSMTEEADQDFVPSPQAMSPIATGSLAPGFPSTSYGPGDGRASSSHSRSSSMSSSKKQGRFANMFSSHSKGGR